MVAPNCQLVVPIQKLSKALLNLRLPFLKIIAKELPNKLPKQ